MLREPKKMYEGDLFITRRAERPSKVQIARYGSRGGHLVDGKSRWNPECTDREIKVAVDRDAAVSCCLSSKNLPLSPLPRWTSSGRAAARRYRARRMGIDSEGRSGERRMEETKQEQGWKEEEGWKIRIIETRQLGGDAKSGARGERRKKADRRRRTGLAGGD